MIFIMTRQAQEQTKVSVCIAFASKILAGTGIVVNVESELGSYQDKVKQGEMPESE